MAGREPYAVAAPCGAGTYCGARCADRCNVLGPDRARLIALHVPPAQLEGDSSLPIGFARFDEAAPSAPPQVSCVICNPSGSEFLIHGLPEQPKGIP